MTMAKSPLLHKATVFLIIGLGIVLVTGGCSKITLPRLEFEKEQSQDPSIPLRVRVELDPLLREAAFPYTDNCGEPRALTVGKRLSEMLVADTRKVFQEVIEREDPSQGMVADAVLHFAVEEKRYDLAILGEQKSWTDYPAKATLRVRAVLREAANEEVIFSRSVKWRTASGTMPWEGSSRSITSWNTFRGCDVRFEFTHVL